MILPIDFQHRMLRTCCPLYSEAARGRRGGSAEPGWLWIVHRRDTAAEIVAMSDRDPNDTRLITPLLLMGVIVVCGLLYFAYLGHA
jgi:hypothetical protein